MKSYPIDSILPRLKEAVRANPCVVLQAPPGSGKTTRAPLALLELIPSEKGRIIMLEPRRIAAVSAAGWMAQTLGEQAGETVGYTIRFESRVSKKTRIEVVTEGILTRRIQADPGLEGVALVIFDEFHERSIHADLGLALCLDILRNLREDLKIIVMSATLEGGPIAALLGNAPVVSSGGEAFPVEERYYADDRKKSLKERIAETVRTALIETTGDILVFLPGAGEIHACSEALQKVVEKRKGDISIHPLYGDLPFEEQQRAVLPCPKRKIVLATNIAESSLTIEGIRVVIDSGLTRRLQYDPTSGMNRLITGTVSKASAEQRKGRAGRLGPGLCLRLYSRHAFESMIPFTQPEILASDLSSLVLELAAWGVGDPATLSWLDAPPAASWESALRLLRDLDALNQKGTVTQTGRSMARLPLHPRLGRMLLKAAELGCVGQGADLAAILAERDIIRRSQTGRITYSDAADISERLSNLRKWRKTKTIPDCVDPWALRAVDRTSQQLMRLMAAEQDRSSEEPHADTIARLLLRAFPDRIAKKRDSGDGRFILRPGRGVRLASPGSLANSPFIIAVKLDAGEKAEGMVYLAQQVTEDLLRQELGNCIRTVRRIEWAKKEARVVSALEEQLDALLLSSRPFSPSDEEAAPLLCEAIRSDPGLVTLSREALQFLARVSLMKRTFPDENWPDLSAEGIMQRPEDWLLPWLGKIRTGQQLACIDILPALKARLSWEQQRLLDERAPVSILVPSGHRVAIDYASGDIPVLSVKLQEMFGLADTPEVADGLVRVLLHLLSPAQRPVQVTQDLKGFWNSGYQLVKKELKGRYPRHPWPDDPWNAVPTRKAKPRGS
ncbi:MAG: ATP-dependent helicase HrpB [Nitrospirae bacterium]|nr:ATP-dependent helicase HrpB [Nitrospirota bacterium]